MNSSLAHSCFSGNERCRVSSVPTGDFQVLFQQVQLRLLCSLSCLVNRVRRYEVEGSKTFSEPKCNKWWCGGETASQEMFGNSSVHLACPTCRRHTVNRNMILLWPLKSISGIFISDLTEINKKRSWFLRLKLPMSLSTLQSMAKYFVMSFESDSFQCFYVFCFEFKVLFICSAKLIWFVGWLIPTDPSGSGTFPPVGRLELSRAAEQKVKRLEVGHSEGRSKGHKWGSATGF